MGKSLNNKRWKNKGKNKLKTTWHIGYNKPSLPIAMQGQGQDPTVDLAEQDEELLSVSHPSNSLSLHGQLPANIF